MSSCHTSDLLSSCLFLGFPCKQSNNDLNFVCVLPSLHEKNHTGIETNEQKYASDLILALACILCAFVPFLFTSAVSMAFFLQIACVLPPSSEDAVIDDNCEDSQPTSESIQTSNENKLSDTSL